MAYRLFKYRWASLASKEGALSSEKMSLKPQIWTSWINWSARRTQRWKMKLIRCDGGVITDFSARPSCYGSILAKQIWSIKLFLYFHISVGQRGHFYLISACIEESLFWGTALLVTRLSRFPSAPQVWLSGKEASWLWPWMTTTSQTSPSILAIESALERCWKEKDRKICSTYYIRVHGSL